MYTGCLIGILMMTYSNPPCNWVGFHPLLTAKIQGYGPIQV